MEFLEWIKLPQDLQHRFFELADEESKRVGESIQKLNKEYEKLQFLQSYFDKLPNVESVSRIAAIDSSKSPRLSERLGIRYGVFASGIIYLKGNEREESFRAGVFKRRQAFSEDKSRFFFDLLTTYAERRLALEALSKSDLVILDGSFYGFVYSAVRIKKQGLYGTEEERLIREISQDTEKLLKSGKVIGVIKRSHTRVIGGYLALQDRNNPFVSIIDKLILSLIMPVRTVFDYHKLIGDKPVHVYTRLARYAQSSRWSESPLEEAERWIYSPFEYLELDPSEFKGLRRMQVRAYDYVPPCEIEYPSRIETDRILEWMGQPNFFNEATNLPLALDLIDSAVTLSSKFTEEFVSEVEGRVLESIDKNGGNRETIRIFFSLLNPQKPY
ncbi:MAG: DNA double-strand break repair nuclease NurA [Nitrososphaerota archaeon]|nr:DNA double-strand break repair nuclease NurA [Nitrososphaerales archaeon]MDW8044705.1 DNA double-strand break repair nuclease NurA [Nitrososphaerota archaeon]